MGRKLNKGAKKESRLCAGGADALCCPGGGPDLFLQPFFKVILDETRRELIRFIGRNPGLTAGEIASAFRQDRSTISHHLSVMTANGFLSVSRQGRNRLYRVNREYIVKTLEEITESMRSCCQPSDLGSERNMLHKESRARVPAAPGTATEVARTERNVK